LPLTDLDAHYWQPGWQPTPTDLWRPRVGELVAQPEWVMDGNYTSALDLRLPSADTIVFLDLSRRVPIPRVLRRGLRWRAQVRPGMAPDCPERVTAEFLRWLWRFPSQGRRRLLTAIDTAAKWWRQHPDTPASALLGYYLDVTWSGLDRISTNAAPDA